MYMKYDGRVSVADGDVTFSNLLILGANKLQWAGGDDSESLLGRCIHHPISFCFQDIVIELVKMCLLLCLRLGDEVYAR